MLTTEQIQVYHKLRRDGMRPVSAILYARDHDSDGPFMGSVDERVQFERGGFTFEAWCEIDGCPDISYLGDWKQYHQDGDVDSLAREYQMDPDELGWGRGDRLRWFRPQISLEEHRCCLSRMGFSRHEAYTKAREYILRDHDRAFEYGTAWHTVVVVVTASRCGVELGRAILGEIESDSDQVFLTETMMDLADEAQQEAEAKLDCLVDSVC